MHRRQHARPRAPAGHARRVVGHWVAFLPTRPGRLQEPVRRNSGSTACCATRAAADSDQRLTSAVALPRKVEMRSEAWSRSGLARHSARSLLSVRSVFSLSNNGGEHLFLCDYATANTSAPNAEQCSTSMRTKSLELRCTRRADTQTRGSSPSMMTKCTVALGPTLKKRSASHLLCEGRIRARSSRPS